MTVGAPPATEPAGAPPPAAAAGPRRRVVLIGNPNTGKSTLFNALTGLQARVANYPGVTVEKKIGLLAPGIELIDLPGTYSLAAHSPDEAVAVQVLLGDLAGEPRPDLAVVIADASNLPRNLFLCTQVIETGLPTVLALNMVDAAAGQGITIDAAKVSAALGIPVIPTVASKNTGIDALKALLTAAILPPPAAPGWQWPADLSAAVEQLAVQFGASRFSATRALIDADGAMEQQFVAGHGAAAGAALTAARAALTAAGTPPPKAEAQMRYAWISRAMQPCIQRGERPAGGDFTDRLDGVLTHRLFGSLVFVALMTLVFVSIFLAAKPFMGWIDDGFAWLATVVNGWFVGTSLDGGMLQSMVVDGAIPGVSGVLVFLPQIAFLFLFIALLEDSGYMSRAAFLMDRVLRFCGLSGHSFIPMMSSFACAIPGVMAARTIANPRDRLTTILVAPLMSCSARIPVYALMCAAFVPSKPLYGTLPGLVFAAMYFVGIGTAVPVAWLLKKTLLKGPPPPFVLELPQYRMPVWRNVGLRVWGASKEFVVRAGTAIFALSLVVWALLYFPHAQAIGDKFNAERAPLEAQKKSLEPEYQRLQGLMDPLQTARQALLGPGAPDRGATQPALQPPTDPAARAEYERVTAAIETLQPALAAVQEPYDRASDQLAEFDALEEGEYIRDSLMGRLGQGIEPAVKPLGWDWRIGVGALASFPAREVIVSTLRIIYNLGGDDGGDEEAGREKLARQLQRATWPDGRKVFTLPVALSIMVFFALCAQCAATLVTIRKETGSWKWSAFTFLYMTTLAYVGAMATFQLGTWLMSLL